MPHLLCLLTAAWTSVAHAQGGPEIHAQSISGLSVEAVNEESTQSLETSLDIVAVGFSTPLPPLKLVPERWVVIALADFEYTRLRFEGARLPTAEDHDLYRARLGLLNLAQISDKLGVVALVQPGFYSDFGGPLSTDDVGLTALVLGSWTFSASLSAGLGGGYVLFFGRPRWVPFGQLQLDRDRVQVDVLLPRVATVWWNAAGPLWLGAEAEIDGGFYRLHPDNTDALQAVFQEYSRSRAGLGARLRVRDKLIFELTGAVIPQTRATLYLDADSDLLDYELSPGWSVVGQISLDLGQ